MQELLCRAKATKLELFLPLTESLFKNWNPADFDEQVLSPAPPEQYNRLYEY